MYRNRIDETRGLNNELLKERGESGVAWATTQELIYRN